MPLDLSTVQSVIQKHNDAMLRELGSLTSTSGAPASQTRAAVDILFIGNNLPRTQILALLGNRSVAFAAWADALNIAVRERIVAFTSDRARIEALRRQYPTEWMIVWAMPQSSIETAQHQWRMSQTVRWIDVQADTGNRVGDPQALARALVAEWTAKPSGVAALVGSTSSARMTDALLERLIRCSTGLNEITPPAGPNPEAAWRRGATSTIGSVLCWGRPADRPDVADIPDWVPVGRQAGNWATMLLPWGVLFRDQSYQGGETWVELCAADLQLVRRGATLPERVSGYVTDSVGWHAVFGYDMASVVRDQCETRPSSTGKGISIRVPADGNSHFSLVKAAIQSPETIEGLVTMLMVRRDPRSAPGLVGVQVGIDPYPGAGNFEDYGMAYTAAVGCSAVMRVTDDWQPVGYASVPNSFPPGGDNPVSRLMSLERLRSCRPLA